MVVNIKRLQSAVRRHQFDVLGRAFIFLIEMFQIVFRNLCDLRIAPIGQLLLHPRDVGLHLRLCPHLRVDIHRRIAAEIGKKIIYEFLAEPPGGYAREGNVYSIREGERNVR